MMRLAVAIAFALSLAAGPAQADDSWLIGRWHGRVDEPSLNLHYDWLLHRRADGTFVTYIRNPNCIRQAGVWRFESGHYISHVLSVNGRKVDYIDRYKLLRHDADNADYYAVGPGIRQHATRVDDRFALPGCPGTQPSS